MQEKPTIYIAGKIAQHDWRGKLVRGVELYTDDEELLFDPNYRIDQGAFYYGGPFFVACDHCCAHGHANHGVGASGDAGCMSGFWGNENSTPRRVFKVNRQRVARADIVFAYIDQLDCFGTMIELGMAAELGKDIAVCFDPQLSRSHIRDFWMARLCAVAVYERHTVEDAWRLFLNNRMRLPRAATRWG